MYRVLVYLYRKRSNQAWYLIRFAFIANEGKDVSLVGPDMDRIEFVSVYCFEAGLPSILTATECCVGVQESSSAIRIKGK